MSLSVKFRRFRRKHKSLRVLIVAITVIILWRGVWSILDIYLPTNSMLNWIAIGIAVIILYLDDFTLKELK